MALCFTLCATPSVAYPDSITRTESAKIQSCMFSTNTGSAQVPACVKAQDLRLQLASIARRHKLIMHPRALLVEANNVMTLHSPWKQVVQVHPGMQEWGVYQGFSQVLPQ